jgi:dTDP-4-dehydrorhamnose reductase
VSTDLVFSGERPFFREDDPAQPASVYGATKREGEQAVLGLCADAAVARVALVSGHGYGRHPTASESIAWALRAGGRPRLFTDQYRTPVDPESVADALVSLLHGSRGGLYHLGGPERLSRFELGLRVAAIHGLDARRIEPVRQGEVALTAPRPSDVSLDSSRARDLLAWLPRPVDDAIRAGRLRPD